MHEVGDAEPLVQRVLPSMPPIPVPDWLVSHREVHTSRRVRMVFDLLAEDLGPSRRSGAPSRKPQSERRRRGSAPRRGAARLR